MSEKKKTLTSQEFLEKLLQKQREKGVDHYNLEPNKDLEKIRNEEIDLIDKSYNFIIDETLKFCDKNDNLRNDFEVMLSISFSIFASIFTKIIENDLIDREQFITMFKDNLNKLFEDTKANIQVTSNK